jgi:hypothetical protein
MDAGGSATQEAKAERCCIIQRCPKNQEYLLREIAGIKKAPEGATKKLLLKK